MKLISPVVPLLAVAALAGTITFAFGVGIIPATCYALLLEEKKSICLRPHIQRGIGLRHIHAARYVHVMGHNEVRVDIKKTVQLLDPLVASAARKYTAALVLRPKRKSWRGRGEVSPRLLLCVLLLV